MAKWALLIGLLGCGMDDETPRDTTVLDLGIDLASPGVAPDLAPEVPRLPNPSRWGVLAGGGRRWLNGVDNPNDAYALATDAGIGWVSLLIRWHRVQPTENGPIEWGTPIPTANKCQEDWCPVNPQTGLKECLSADGLVAEALAAGLSVNVKVWGTPAWAAEPGCKDDVLCPPRDELVFKKFMAEAARHFNGKVSSWTLWIESDNPPTNAYGAGGGFSGGKCNNAECKRQKWRDRIFKAGFDGIVSAVGTRPKGTIPLIGTGPFLETGGEVLNGWLKESGTVVRDIDFVGVEIIKNTSAEWKTATVGYNDWAARQTPAQKIWILGGGCATSCAAAGCQIQCGCEPNQTRDSMRFSCGQPQVEKLFWSRLHDATGEGNCFGEANVGCKLGFLSSEGKPREKLEELKRFVRDEGGCNSSQP